jgi:AcrR family transcriptional regulator
MSDRKQQIMQVAERLFTTGRFHEITLDQVAQQAAVGKGTIYRYFADKDDLVFEVAVSGFSELCDLIGSCTTERRCDFRARLTRVCVEITRYFTSRRQWFQLMQAEAGRMHCAQSKLRERWLSHRGKLVAAVAAVIQAGQEQGQVRPELRAETLAHYLLGMIRAHVVDVGADAPAEAVVGLFLSGCGAKGVRPFSRQENRHERVKEE